MRESLTAEIAVLLSDTKLPIAARALRIGALVKERAEWDMDLWPAPGSTVGSAFMSESKRYWLYGRGLAVQSGE